MKTPPIGSAFRLPQHLCAVLSLWGVIVSVPAYAAIATNEAFPAMRVLWDREPAQMKAHPADPRREALFREAERNSRAAAEALYRCRRFVDGWLAYADPKTGLIPRNLGNERYLWNGRDAAADNYPFMVLSCALTDRAMFEGRMRDMLRAEIRHTSRLDRLGDHYSFTNQGFVYREVQLDRLVFDNAEYVKDGLIPLTEWLGPSPWSDRMIGLVEDIWKHAPVATPYGNIPTLNFEVNGDLLQACSRLYWFTGQRKYLDWAIRLGDYYLLSTNHPTRHMSQLRLIDHGCEVLNGLSELYVAVSRVVPEKRQAYAEPLRALIDRVLAIGRNEHGLLYSWIKGPTGEHSRGLCDTWGYDYDSFYTVHLVDQVPAYRDAVRTVLGNLYPAYLGMPWEDSSADGHADAIEGALNLMNREPVEGAARWIDHQMRLMWAVQRPNGVIEGWHGDGNIARTSIMYALWKSQGARIVPWRSDLRLGAVVEKGTLLLSLAADQPWSGKLMLDRPRHRDYMHLPMDYPRINQFPEWYTVTAEQRFTVEDLSRALRQEANGRELIDGFPVSLPEPGEMRLVISRKP